MRAAGTRRERAVFIAAIYTDIATVTDKRVAVFIPVVHLTGGQVSDCNDMPTRMGSIRGSHRDNGRGVRQVL